MVAFLPRGLGDGVRRVRFESQLCQLQAAAPASWPSISVSLEWGQRLLARLPTGQLQEFINGLDLGCSLQSPKALKTTQCPGPISHQLPRSLGGWEPRHPCSLNLPGELTCCWRASH